MTVSPTRVAAWVTGDGGLAASAPDHLVHSGYLHVPKPNRGKTGWANIRVTCHRSPLANKEIRIYIYVFTDRAGISIRLGSDQGTEQSLQAWRRF